MEPADSIPDLTDPLAAAVQVQRSGSPIEVAKRYEQLVMDLYWKKKDLPAVVIMAHMALSYCLNGRPDTSASAALLESAKKITYNLASFCWPGWDEPGITITDGDLQIGEDAAKLNLKLAIELNCPPLGMLMAYWMLGAYALAFRNFSVAAAHFAQAIKLAKQAGDAGQVSSNEGFLALSRLGQKTPGAESDFARALESLEVLNNDEGREYARQLHVARRVFGL